MLTTLPALATQVPAVIAPMVLNTKGATEFVLANVVPLVLAGLAVLLMSGAHRPNWSKAMSTFGIVVLGLVLLVGAAGLRGFAEQITNAILPG